MPDRDAFLRAIRERPDDDGPRLIYADWLEEQGNPRGEFIRIQCELAKLPPWHSNRTALEEREADLLAAHDYEWLGKPPNWVIGWEFKRGFVERFTITRPTLAGLDALIARSVQPHAAFAVRHPQQFGGESLRELGESPHLDELAGLDWLESVPDVERESLLLLVESPRLRGLRRLGVRGDAAAGEILSALELRTGAVNLRDLEIDSLDAGAASAFFRYRGLNNVDSIAVSREVARPFIHFIPEQPFRWRKLDFGFSGFPVEDVAALAECQRLAELHLLWTQREPVPLPPSLRRLHLNGLALPEFRNLPELEWLHLRIDSGDPRNPQDDSRALGELLQRLRGPVFHLETYGRRLALGALARLPAKDRVRRLVFDCEVVTDAEVRALVELGEFPKLQALHLRCPRFTSRHAEMFAAMPFPPSLRRLSINSALVDDAGLATLLRSPHLQRLTLINVRECQVDWRTLGTLAESPVLPRLRELILPLGGDLTADDIRFFVKTPGVSPLLRVQRR